MIETLQVVALFACGGYALVDGIHRASAWHGPTARLMAVVLNALYMTSGAAVGLAPFLPREQWPVLLTGLLLSAAGLWAVTGRPGRNP
jgi:hypothetical protein